MKATMKAMRIWVRRRTRILGLDDDNEEDPYDFDQGMIFMHCSCRFHSRKSEPHFRAAS